MVANLSARALPISDNGLGYYVYRISKAALSQGIRMMAHDMGRQGTIVMALHSGMTEMDLSGPFSRSVAEGRLFLVEFMINALLGVIDLS